MKNFKSLLLVALVFLAGVIAGVVGTRIVVRHIVGEMVLHPESVQPRIERNLVLRLQLDREQRAQMHVILSNAHTQLESLRHEYRPQMVLVLSNANAQITDILTPEQQVRFQRWKERNRPLLDAIRQHP